MKAFAAAVVLLCCFLQETRAGCGDEFQEMQRKLAALEAGKVAFGATLGGAQHYGPYANDTTLIFKNVYTNYGNAYSSITGIFTAPLNGVYYFSLSGHVYTSKAMGLRLMKNGIHQLMAFNHASTTPLRYETAANSMTLTLEKNDTVYINLMENTWIMGSNLYKLSSFNGNLIFSL